MIGNRIHHSASISAKYDICDIHDSCLKSFESGCATVNVSQILCCKSDTVSNWVANNIKSKVTYYSFSIIASADLCLNIPLGHTIKKLCIFQLLHTVLVRNVYE